jgi:hypothetical protein
MWFLDEKGAVLRFACTRYTPGDIFLAEEVHEAMRIFGRNVSVTDSLFPLKVSRAKSISDEHCSAEHISHTHWPFARCVLYTWLSARLTFQLSEDQTRPSHLSRLRLYFLVLRDTITCLELRSSSQCVLYTAKWARCTKTCISLHVKKSEFTSPLLCIIDKICSLLTRFRVMVKCKNNLCGQLSKELVFVWHIVDNVFLYKCVTASRIV